MATTTVKPLAVMAYQLIDLRNQLDKTHYPSPKDSRTQVAAGSAFMCVDASYRSAPDRLEAEAEALLSESKDLIRTYSPSPKVYSPSLSDELSDAASDVTMEIAYRMQHVKDSMYDYREIESLEGETKEEKLEKFLAILPVEVGLGHLLQSEDAIRDLTEASGISKERVQAKASRHCMLVALQNNLVSVESSDKLLESIVSLPTEEVHMLLSGLKRSETPSSLSALLLYDLIERSKEAKGALAKEALSDDTKKRENVWQLLFFAAPFLSDLLISVRKEVKELLHTGVQRVLINLQSKEEIVEAFEEKLEKASTLRCFLEGDVVTS